MSGTCAVPTTPAGMDDGTTDTTVALDATLTYTVSVHRGAKRTKKVSQNQQLVLLIQYHISNEKDCLLGFPF